MADDRFRSVVVVGTGMMGPGIAAAMAAGGLETTILSRSEAGASAGLESARAHVSLLARHGLLDGAAASRASGLLRGAHSFEDAIGGADIVIESAPEDLRFKQDLFSRLDSVARPGAVLASNTSGLSITAIAQRCAHPERVLTTHFWNPPHLIPLVEVVKGERTADEVAREVHGLLAACGKTPVLVKKDRPGQIGNRLQMALFREAISIVEEGIAEPEGVDLAARAGFGLRLPVYGILEHIDAVGLDLAGTVLDSVSRDINNEPGMPRLMREKIARGELGVKAGRGFYDWSRKDFAELRARRDEFVLEFLKSKHRR